MHKIEWTDKTWNVITGCTQISPACDNCYAKAMTKRLQGMARKELEKETNFKCKECGFDFCGHSEIEDFIDDEFYSEIYCAGDCGGLEIHKPFDLPKYYLGWDKVVFHKECLNDILDKKKYPSGSKIFVNSMSDTFHMDISDDDLVKLFYDMSQRQDLIFQVLTKRASRILDFFNFCLQKYKFSNFTDYLYRNMCKHIWFGVTAENQEYADKRIPKLLKLKDVLNKNIKCFVSIEPCLEDIDLSAYLDRLDWVIIGGEKIPNNPSKTRLMEWEWVDSIYNQCKKYRVSLFLNNGGILQRVAIQEQNLVRNFHIKKKGVKMENFEDCISEFIGEIEEVIKHNILPAHDNFTKEQLSIIKRVLKEKLEEAESEICDEIEEAK